MTRLVQIFDRPCCGPSAAAELADFLRIRVGDDTSIEYHNLAAGGGQEVKVPGALIGHLGSGGALPVIAVDGQLVATGTLPNMMDALDLAQAARPGRRSPSPPSRLRPVGSARRAAAAPYRLEEGFTYMTITIYCATDEQQQGADRVAEQVRPQLRI